MPISEPSPPIKLMMALPSDRKAGGVKSGIRATTGARQSDMTNTNRMIKTIVSGREPSSANTGISANRKAQIGAPNAINGRRLPNLE